jgi:vacuolar-type H+-ATPase subunit H
VSAIPGPGVEQLLQELRDALGGARSRVWGGSSAGREDLVALVDEIRAHLPQELSEARWLLREREEYRRRMEVEGAEILEAARLRAEQMVSRSEILREAERRAKTVVRQAEDDARRLRHDVDAYCAERLGELEALLGRTLRSLVAGRERLAIRLGEVSPEPPAPAPEEAVPAPGLFDQDRSAR